VQRDRMRSEEVLIKKQSLLETKYPKWKVSWVKLDTYELTVLKGSNPNVFTTLQTLTLSGELQKRYPENFGSA
jgi:hypothetical protein